MLPEVKSKNLNLAHKLIGWCFFISGINLLQVAVHEFGHSLGLEHSNNNNAVMAPFYRGYEPNLQLKNDDIAGIQSIYGKL